MVLERRIVKNISNLLSSPWIKVLLITVLTGFLSQLVEELRVIDTPTARIAFHSLINVVLLLKTSPFTSTVTPPDEK